LITKRPAINKAINYRTILLQPSSGDSTGTSMERSDDVTDDDIIVAEYDSDTAGSCEPDSR